MSIIRKRNDEVEVNLLEVGSLLLHRVHLILLSTMVCGLLLYAGAIFLIVPKYEASTTLYVNNTANREGASSITQSDLNASAQLVDTYVAIITSRTVLSEVIEQSGVDLQVGELASKISASAINGTEVFHVSVKHEDPLAAAALANAIAETAPAQIAEIVEGSSVRIVDYAVIPTNIAEPNYNQCLLAGLLAGCVLSIIIILVRTLLDTTVKEEGDLSQWPYPLLCTIPDLEEAEKTSKRGYGYGSYRK